MPRMTLRPVGANAAAGAIAPAGTPLIKSSEIKRVMAELRITEMTAAAVLAHAARGDRAKVRKEIDRIEPHQMSVRERGAAFHRVMTMAT